MILLVYGDIGGSGGYVRYCRGLFGSGVVPDDWEVFFVCSPAFAAQLHPLDPQVRIVSHPWMASSRRWQRYLWHLVLFPLLARRVRPDVEFFPSGRRRILWRRAVSVVTCHNLLLFSPLELARFSDNELARAFLQERGRLARSFHRASGVIFLSTHSREVVQSAVPSIRHSRERAWEHLYSLWSPRIAAERLVALSQGLLGKSSMPEFEAGPCSRVG